MSILATASAAPPAPVSSKPIESDRLLPSMSLRDWFAGQAIIGLIPAPKQAGVPALTVDGMAKAAYAYADALLKCRNTPRA